MRYKLAACKSLRGMGMCASPAASIFPHVPMCALRARCAFAVSQHQLARGTVRASSDMSRRLIPLLDRVLVQKVAAPEKSIGGVLLPETASKVCILYRRPEEAGSSQHVTSKSTTCTYAGRWPSQRRTCMHATIGIWVQQAQAAQL
jgi:Chaperonin 10 Kd subunit